MQRSWAQLGRRQFSGVGGRCCVLDLDNTVLARRAVTQDPLAGLRLYLGRERTGACTGTIMPGCRQAVQALSRAGWSFVAVTARWGSWPRCRANTEAWLEANGIPMPVRYAGWPYPTDRPRARFKAGAIRQLMAEGRRVVVGVGDRPSDMRAYAQTGLRCFIVTDALGEIEGHSQKLVLTERQLREQDPSVQIEYFESSANGSSAWKQIEMALLDEISNPPS